jgi:hypothetical protein
VQVSVDKPGTPGELVELAHHGVKGMKWGTRKSGSEINRESNRRLIRKAPTSRDRAQEIRKARARSNLKFQNYADAPNKATKAKLKKVYLKDPDRATGLRLTRGEKVVAGILLGSGVATVPIAVGLGVQVGVRRHIQKKQARGGYG